MKRPLVCVPRTRTRANGQRNPGRTFEPEAGAPVRSSIGTMIPLNAPVNCEAEVEIDGGEG